MIPLESGRRFSGASCIGWEKREKARTGESENLNSRIAMEGMAEGSGSFPSGFEKK